MGESNDSEGADVLHLISSFLGTRTGTETEAESEPRTGPLSTDASVNAIGRTGDLMGGTEEVAGEETLIESFTETKAAAKVDDGDGTVVLNSSRDDSKCKSACVRASATIDRVVIFSKDRPWQLQQLLRSIFIAMDFNVVSCPYTNQYQNQYQYQHQYRRLQIHIIVNVTDLFRDGYEQVKTEYDTIVEKINRELLDDDDMAVSIVWMYEYISTSSEVEDLDETTEKHCEHGDTENLSFARLLEEAVGYSFDNRKDDSDNEEEITTNDDDRPCVFIMFLTDDCILIEPLSDIFSAYRNVSQHYENQCDENDSGNGDDILFGFLTRLHPGITYSQTRDEPSPPPPRSYFTYHQNSRSTICSGLSSDRNNHNANGSLDAFVYPKHIASSSSSYSPEFNYSFDLSGGIYRQQTIMKILTLLRKKLRGGGTSYYSHPNTFEIHANNVLQLSRNDDSNMHHVETDALWKKNLLLSIPARPSLLILAINRVQDICHAPIAIAQTQRDDECDGESSIANISCTPENLLKYLYQGQRLDLNEYKSRMFHASHIGSVFLESNNDCMPSTSTCDFSFRNPENVVDEIEYLSVTGTAVDNSRHLSLKSDDVSKNSLSVLIPVHCGPPPAASLALKSVIYQVLNDNDNFKEANKVISKMQVVIVDDRCTDGSVDVMLQTLEIFSQQCHQKGTIATTNIAIRDHRSRTEYPYSIMEVPLEDIYIDVVYSPSSGVGAALNHGLQCCHHDFVARMDADDISCPGRFVCQMRYLHHHPSVKVLGTHSIIFSDVSRSTPCSDSVDRQSGRISLPNTITLASSIDTHESYDVIRCSLEPTDAGFVAWCTLFSCVIVHPSVMMRKSSVLDVGGYACECEHRLQDKGPSVSVTEDYDLWLRLIHDNVRSVCSIPRVGVYHRKHASRSPNDQRARKQRDESINISLCAISDYVGDNTHLSFEIVEALKYPDSSKCVEVLNGAADLLCRLEEVFVMKNRDNLTRNEMKLVELDCNERIGELATIAIQKFGRIATQGSAWGKWNERCPDHLLERIALLCNAVI